MLARVCAWPQRMRPSQAERDPRKLPGSTRDFQGHCAAAEMTSPIYRRLRRAPATWRQAWRPGVRRPRVPRALQHLQLQPGNRQRGPPTLATPAAAAFITDAFGTHSARALVASKHAKLKGIHLLRTSHARA